MKSLALLVLASALANAAPDWDWRSYASPEATTVVGIEWSTLKNSPFAATIEAGLSPSGALGLPNLPLLKEAREIVISAPALFAVEIGDFPAATFDDQALHAGLKRSPYHDIALWLPEPENRPGGVPNMGVAQISEQLLIVGSRQTLEAAIDASLAEDHPAASPLLAKTSHAFEIGDLWAAAVDQDRVNIANPKDLAAAFKVLATPEKPVAFVLNHVEDPKPLYIFILNLDDGVHKTQLAPTQSFLAESAELTAARVVRIFNLDEGVRGFVLQP